MDRGAKCWLVPWSECHKSNQDFFSFSPPVFTPRSIVDAFGCDSSLSRKKLRTQVREDLCHDRNCQALSWKWDAPRPSTHSLAVENITTIHCNSHFKFYLPAHSCSKHNHCPPMILYISQYFFKNSLMHWIKNGAQKTWPAVWCTALNASGWQVLHLRHEGEQRK